ncbi:hypothetical protein SU69_05155 [Thermosipho melanesiensis]|uniref:UPF0597 protein Tmel_1007 n=2 Tax=Thermosipho melanesiensis TaxID=46541 RepID=Y1007_THEM4|nr:L-serine ammonia-lyase, iron-sulfur-dependent, subunit alpha [Thermosipho melanesiensis]A6LLR7.1 RecName: Full=UPF0597 protein Tmel_1007 [Thermosipho melanesiensis BI429]ABR30868.1 protein of unknown function DUF1063 [Thermosipho melanesiensis BI429]APT73987.1 hypothetical protein BW47_05395 [Thermosipho melanesiensis]OOC35918.1 hypothetical protein SU68_05210 [Thermosipho melanesiensis]OOC38420.1 hypothetical protein SU69_05155 [Thermosipho melanesiensis]OOC38881.1 hypothetical protein SU
MLKDIFFEQVKPAYGCTEPIAIALSTAVGKKYSKGNVKSINITLDKNTYKNGLVVNIPGTNTFGLELAAALGYLCGDGNKGLEVLKDINEDCLKKAMKMKNMVNISLNEEQHLFVNTTIIAENTVQIVIEGKHDNIAKIVVNDKVIKNEEFHPGMTSIEKIKNYSLDKIIKYVEHPDEDVLKYVEKAIDMNLKIAEYGINTKGNFSNAAINEYVKYVSAGVDARMSGVLMPVMTVAGSGNQGLACILPIAIFKGKVEREKLLKATLLSILVTIYIKAYTGLLTPICGAGSISSAGAAAGLTYLKGGNNTQIKNAINDTLGTLFGLTCDGAKRGCALKAITGTFTALQVSSLALNNIDVPCGNGIVAKDVEETIRRVEKLTNSVKNFDKDVLDYIGKC